MRMKMKMKMNELKMNKLKKEMKNPSIISPSERFSEINNIVQLSIFMSISLRNFKMKPKHSFSYLSRPEKYSSQRNDFLPAIFYLKYYLGIIFLLSGSG